MVNDTEYYHEDVIDIVEDRLRRDYHKVSDLNWAGDYIGFWTVKEFSSLEEFYNYYGLEDVEETL